MTTALIRWGLSNRAPRFTAALILALSMTALVSPPEAQAGGYDTPMLYSARHLGMGGTAVGYVDDPSALFHNPAGLSGTEKLTLMGDFSLLVGTITGNPAENDQNITSETTVGPFFLAGGSGRINEWLTAGLAVYPVASAGATYAYDGGTDSTTLFFLEISPGIAFEIPNSGFSIGAGYRITYASLDRERDVGTVAGFALTGISFAGFRIGAKYEFLDHFSVGLTYRHKTVTDVEGDGYLLNADAVETYNGSFTLPSRFSMGGRVDFGAFGGAIDAEYALQSQNPRGRITGGIIPVTQVSDWQNAWTVRLGAEYRLLDGKLPIRLGFIWDQQTSNRAYPTAFGTPPAPTFVGTIGVGYNAGPWQINAAYAYRTGGTTITAADIDGRAGCLSCGAAGEYSIALNGLYFDFSYHFGRGETRESGSGVVYTPLASGPVTQLDEEPEAESLIRPTVDTAPATNTIDTTTDAARSTVDSGADAADSANDSASDLVDSAGDAVDDSVDSAGDATGDVVDSATDATRDALAPAADEIGDALN